MSQLQCFIGQNHLVSVSVFVLMLLCQLILIILKHDHALNENVCLCVDLSNNIKNVRDFLHFVLCHRGHSMYL